VDLIRQVIVFDAIDIDSESAFWAGLLNGSVMKDENGKWHSVIDANSEWVLGVQFASNHVPPNWPDGEQQQVHLDFHVDNFDQAHRKVMELGATLLQASDNFEADQGFQVYSSPAGHPFCLGWGHPSKRELRAFLELNRNVVAL
jgi:hypothetical protein